MLYLLNYPLFQLDNFETEILIFLNKLTSRWLYFVELEVEVA